LDGLLVQDGDEAHLFRAMCDAEFLSIVENNNIFTPYDFAMELKWFALNLKDAKAWGRAILQWWRF
jgi:hypothetical protein